jgi:hypothetical protein
MGDNHKNAQIWRGHWKFFSSRTTDPEELRFTLKLSDIAQIWACTNYGPRGLGGATKGETIFTHVNLIESFKMKHLANFNQT